MKFNYQARTKTGEIRTGSVEASSKEVAAIILQRYGFYVTFLEIAAPQFYEKKVKLFGKISGKEIVLFSRQLAIMFKSKVPMVETLKVLAAQTQNTDFKEKIVKISEDVEGGTAFSRALSQYPKIFSSFYVATIKAGEASGSLSDSLDYLAGHLEREYHLTAKIRGALIYPALIIFVVFAVLGLMIFYVIPNLTEVLLASGAELPLPTRIILGLADFMRTYGWLLLIFLGGAAILSVRYYLTKSGRILFDKLFLKIPLMGSFLKMMYLSRFAENLSTLISAGIPITQALEIITDIIGNTSYKKIVAQTREEVGKGEAISAVLARFPELFPPIFVQMTAVGEKTGTLDSTLMNVVDFYRKDLDLMADNLVSVIEPVIIIFLGVVVGGIMLAVLMPLYQTIAL
ncbi:MAG: type II secretion system F family protein [bacterium]|nr:type II secretion system F family protein [bacterium]